MLKADADNLQKWFSIHIVALYYYCIVELIAWALAKFFEKL